MCGINLLINPETNGEVAIRKMMLATQHRGPDHSNYSKITDNIWIAGNRLKILDLGDTSNQPMWSEDNRSVLVWNGALYNYQDLRNKLIDLGHTFHSNSDSEVLLQWLGHYGADKIASLKGMFAFVFINLETRKIIIARDPSGEKPLYFRKNGILWHISSEAKGVLAGLSKIPEIDKHQFLPYFYSRHSFPDKSFYKEVQQLLPGNGIILNFEGEEIDGFHWTHAKTEKIAPEQKVFEDKLKDAVLKTFHAERPVGLILSGGADSSLLYRLWIEETGTPTPTFTAAFEPKLQQKYNDPAFARELTSKYGDFHNEVLITPEKIRNHWDEYILGMDQPIGDSAGILTWLIAKEAKKSVKVLISGAGADELFAGYTRHLAFGEFLKKLNFYLKLKQWTANLPLPSPYKKFLKSIESDPRRTFINFASLQNIPEEDFPKFLAWYPNSPSTFQNALNFDRSYYLVNDVLKIHDNACMAHGIEGRSPYLDYDLIEWATSFSEEQSLMHLGKKMIKEALTSRGLGKIASRKKLGFGMPIKEWLEDNEDFRYWVFDGIREMHSEWHPQFPEEMQAFTKAPEKVPKDGFLLVWNLFILATWLKYQQ
ncbi:asparagine synthase (glutamine-hydrolyzing) [Belliella marina]|uniref:asparagine synthase (glutamine-hydrolyzing) n=1 Tax=Belliella marina TaxID=1644146 RepID=A0ABW4VI22_9BACT